METPHTPALAGGRSAFRWNLVRQYALFLACLAVLAFFLIWPILLLVVEGFKDTAADGTVSYTAAHVLGVFADPILRTSLINSVLMAAIVTLLSLIIALPLAILSTRYEFRGKPLLSALLLVPLILPPFVGAIGLRYLLGRFGAINALLTQLGLVDAATPLDFLGGSRFWGVALMEALHLYPIVYLNASAALANLDPALEQAASNLGAGRWTRFRRIIWPLILPGVFAGSTIVFIWSFTELGTPLMFDYYEVAPVQIFWGITEMTTDPRPYALVVVVLLAAVLIYGAGRFAFGGRGHAMSTRAMTGSTSRRLGVVATATVILPFVVVIGLAVMPHLGVVLASLSEPGGWYRTILPTEWTGEHYTAALGHHLAVGSIRNSLTYASLSMLLDLLLGFVIAYLVVRTRVMGRSLLDTLAMLPLAVPGLVLAFGYVAMSLHWPFKPLAGFFESHGLPSLASMCQVTGQVPNPIVFLVIAYAVRRLPYIVRSTVAGLEQTSGELEQAALNLGARPLTTVRRIVLPLIAANIIAGCLLTFSFAMLEVSDSLILAQTENHYPITKAIYALFRRLGDGPFIASAMGVWGMALLTITLVGASSLLGRRLGAIFRV